MDMRKHFERSMLKLLNEKCIDQITINELIQEVGSCKGTFYKYYVDKYDLCNQALANNVYNKINFDESDWDRFFAEYIETISKNSKLLMNVLNSTDINAPIFQNRQMISSMLSRILRLHKVDVEDERVAFVIQSCGTGFMAIICDWLQSGKKKSEKELALGIRGVMPKYIYPYLYQDK